MTTKMFYRVSKLRGAISDMGFEEREYLVLDASLERKFEA